MNFLAHIYLSGKSDEIKVGNFIGDYVKGTKYENYPDAIRKGITFHRNIDSFTDKHYIIHDAKEYLTPIYHKYAGVILDIFLDHFLAAEWGKYSKYSLSQFARHFYVVLVLNYELLPIKVKRILPFFIANNWLESYATIEGIERVLKRMSKRTSLPDKTVFAIKELKENYDFYKNHFNNFFPDLIKFAEDEFGIEQEYKGL